MEKIKKLISKEKGASLVSVLITLVIIQAISLTIMIAVANMNKGSNISNKLVTSSEIANSMFDLIEYEFSKEVNELKNYEGNSEYAKKAAENLFNQNNPNNIAKEVYNLGLRDSSVEGYENYAKYGDGYIKNGRYKINVGYITSDSPEIVLLDNTNPIVPKDETRKKPASENYIQFFVEITYGDLSETNKSEAVVFDRLVVVD